MHYAEKKTLGLVKIQKINDAWAMETKAFDPATGVELTPHVEALSRVKVQKELDALSDQVKEKQDMLADML